MRVIGIDVGIAITGWSIIEKLPTANKPKLIEYGAIFTESHLNIESRLKILFDDLTELIDEYKPDQMAVEDIYFFKNQKTIISVSEARGVILLTGARKGLPIFSYTPLQVKVALTGYGRAEKQQMQKIVKMVYSLNEIPKPDDVADAIAVATCHLNSFKVQI